MAAAPDGFDIFTSVPYATDNDTTTTGSKTANYLNLKNVRRKQRSTKRVEVPIEPAFAAGLPIAPAEHVLCYLRAYCRVAHRACIRRRSAYRACHYTAAGARFANRNLLQRRPKHDSSRSNCVNCRPMESMVRRSCPTRRSYTRGAAATQTRGAAATQTRGAAATQKSPHNQSGGE